LFRNQEAKQLQIQVAEYAGFCYGVKRAIQILDEVIETTPKPVNSEQILAYTLGPIIHNQHVTQYYEKKGIKVIENIQDFIDNRMDSEKLIIRSHGAPKRVYDMAAQYGIPLIDATCPYVKKIQNTVSSYHLKGYNIIVVGDSSHPEVIGINGWCDDQATIIKTLSDIQKIEETAKPTCIVAQTTFNIGLWEKIVDELSKILLNSIVKNTICLATTQRQDACKTLAANVDLMIVVGDRHSSNTKKLVEVCSDIVKTIHIETKDDLNVSKLIGNVKIGVTAGASTPDWIIQSVILKIENEGEVFFDGKS
jgi:4-hydroxy-3-methylbut-2-enyl diphosphate reductase